jgi:hypothetical protein
MKPEVLLTRLDKPKEQRLKGVKTLFKDYDHCSEGERETARLRSRVVRKFAEAKASGIGLEKFCELYNAGKLLPDVREVLGTLTRSRLNAHIKAYTAYGLSGLVPQYHDRGGAGAGLPHELIERIEWLYLDSSKPSVPAVYRALQQYFVPLGIETSLPTVRRVINDVTPAVRDYFRKGAGFFEKSYLAYIKRDYTKFRPMDVIVGDYVTLDFLVRVDGHLWRPKLCAFMDMRTRAIVGWSLQLTANSLGVALALKMCFEQYGLPDTIYFDNGKEFKNYQLCGNEWKVRHSLVDVAAVERDVGIVVEAGVNISFCQPYHGQSKPIERFWRTLHNEFDKGFLTYYGSNTAERPDEVRLYYQNVKGVKKRNINEVEDFTAVEKLLLKHLRYYNECWNHTGNGMDGKAPLMVWAEYRDWRKREIPAEIDKYLWAFRYTTTVQRNEVSHDGEWYFPTSAENIAHIGEKVESRVPLDKRDVVHVFSLPERKFLYDARRVEYADEVERDMETVGRMRQGKKEVLDAYRKRKTKLDKGEYRTQAEIYAMANPAEAELQVVHGKPNPLKPTPKSAGKVGQKLVPLFIQ